MIYKLLPRADWERALQAGVFRGSPVDVADGFIHFSTASQAQETARRYFRDQADLVVLAVDSETLGPSIVWEPSRGGDLFPHLYAELPATHVREVLDAPLGPDGVPNLRGLPP